MAGGRGISAANQAEIDKDTNHPVIFVHFAFDSVGSDQYIHNSLGALNWPTTNPSIDWLGIGDLGRIDAIKEGEALSAYEMRLQLSGLDSDTYMDELVNQNFYGDAIVMYKGFLDTTHQLVDDPFQLWAGEIDTLSAVAGSEATIEVIAESDLALIDKSNGSMFSDANLQDEFPGDLFFQFAAQIKDTRIIWGGKTINYTGNTDSTVGFGPGFPGGGGGGGRFG